MTRCTILLAMIAVLSWGGALAQPPEWSLAQNVPDPFCNVVGDGSTTIAFAVETQAHVLLEVLDTDGVSAVRTLVDGILAAGLHSVIWDGTDSLGVPVPNSSYAYMMTATEEGGTEILFRDTRTAHLNCANPTDPETWGHFKSRYR